MTMGTMHDKSRMITRVHCAHDSLRSSSGLPAAGLDFVRFGGRGGSLAPSSSVPSPPPSALSSSASSSSPKSYGVLVSPPAFSRICTPWSQPSATSRGVCPLAVTAFTSAPPARRTSTAATSSSSSLYSIAARWSAVKPSALVAETSAPSPSSFSMAATWPPRAAYISGVSLVLVAATRLASVFPRMSRIRTCPIDAATCTAHSPVLVAIDGSAFHGSPRRVAAVSSSPQLTATTSDVSFVAFETMFTSRDFAPCSKRASTNWGHCSSIKVARSGVLSTSTFGSAPFFSSSPKIPKWSSVYAIASEDRPRLSVPSMLHPALSRRPTSSSLASRTATGSRS
mmetsp:Transcript_32910/g.86142  ORF Transcript_32910/g.86142 Transcript_32910/m.86142 type:complete len:340 (+) Transcript_32910:409-1428(+)